jgi:DNA-binding winged helix-turn-helix (wHTH) protein
MLQEDIKDWSIPAGSRVRFQFGEFIVDGGARQLHQSGKSVHIGPRAFDLLHVLIRERPRVLSKEDLHKRLWPDTYVTDTSLAMLVVEVRAALGEAAREPQYIRTVHRRGYAFQGDVRELSGVTPIPAAPPPCWLLTPSGPIPLLQGENIVGREPGSRIWLDTTSVSRRHARISVDGDRAILEDLDSKNGTRIGGTRVIAATPLTDGDAVHFGSIATKFRANSTEPTRTEGDA